MSKKALRLRDLKKVCCWLVLTGAFVAQPAWAKNIVTADVPLDSKFYTYVDKLEAMGYITDMTATTRPWSRYDVAKMVAKINPEGMPKYLEIYYEELCDAFSDEIGYIIAHDADELVPKEGNLPAQANDEQQYYAAQYSEVVAEKAKAAQESEHFSNFALRGASTEIGFRTQDVDSFSYGDIYNKQGGFGLNGAKINGEFQPLNTNNNGNRYGNGWNWVNELHMSGNLSNDVAIGVTPRYSLDKDQHGKASLTEGYVKTHIGQLAITVGRQPLQWGGYGKFSGTALSTNATPQTMVRLGLVEPVKIENGFFRFLGKVNATAFVSRLDNREDLAKGWNSGDPRRETNDMSLVGMRAEIQPVDTWSIGLERVSMMRGINRKWFLGKNDGADDLWNDIAGVDTIVKFPGLHLYGSIHGEFQHGLCPTKNFYSGGVYFPQLSSDGRWDLRLETSHSDDDAYIHSSLINGWSYKNDIMGGWIGNDAHQYQGMLRYHADNGDIWSLQYAHTMWKRHDGQNGPTLGEIILGVDHRVTKNFQVGLGFGLARMRNYNNSNGSDLTKFGLAKLKWFF